ncbi:deoxyribose-phosphate aldolase [candidate division GN15 bacterium]|nr:deoxyribose-phosphate aldolase [candidate division GN15 bacterium]
MDRSLSRYIDHTTLSQTDSEADIVRLCDEAEQYAVYAVCVNPIWVKLAAEHLAGSDILVCSVAGFPLGAGKTEIKVAEATSAVDDGADEIDLVANIGWLVADRFVEAEAEIRKVRRHLPSDVVLKVIIECNRLTEQQQINATLAVINAGADIVKTGTGMFGDVTVEQVRTLSSAAGGRVGVKAAGGIRTREQCDALIRAGATRLGCSGTTEIFTR